MSGPNFILLDTRPPEIGGLIATMVQARDAVGRRSWSHPQEPTTEDWWADVLADPRSRRPTTRFRDLADRRPFYRLSDEARATILVACSKCEWPGAFQRDELIAAHGADYLLPDLLDQLAAPDCARLGSFWDRCGIYYVEPIAPLDHRPDQRPR